MNDLKTAGCCSRPSVARVTKDLAISYEKLGKNAEALKFFEEALKLYEEIFPPAHPEVLNTVMALADHLEDMEDWPTCAGLRQTYAERVSSAYGSLSGKALEAQKILAKTYKDSRNLLDAEGPLERIAETCSAIYGEESPETLDAIRDQASNLRGQQRYKEAFEIVEPARLRSEQCLAANNPIRGDLAFETALTIQEGGDWARGDWRRAEHLLTISLGIYEQSNLGKDWLNYSRAMLARAKAGVGEDLEGAEKLLDLIVPDMDPIPDDMVEWLRHDDIVAVAFSDLGKAYHERRIFSQAKKNLKAAFICSINQEVSPHRDSDIEIVMSRLEDVCLDAEAEDDPNGVNRWVQSVERNSPDAALPWLVNICFRLGLNFCFEEENLEPVGRGQSKAWFNALRALLNKKDTASGNHELDSKSVHE